MFKINWKLLAKSILACVAGAVVAATAYVFEVWINTLFVCRGTLCHGTENTQNTFDLVDWLKVMPSMSGLFLALLLVILPIQIFLNTRRLSGVVWQIIPTVLIFCVLGGYMGNTLVHFHDLGLTSHDMDFLAYLESALTGLIAASVVWLIRRPDLDAAPNKPTPHDKAI